MSPELQRITANRRNGSEPFHDGGSSLGFTVTDFWAWSTSDLVSNATRGKLAEFLVAQALNIKSQPVRDEWAPCDLETDDGIRIEVKSAAFLQSWHQVGPSLILFNVPATKKWDPATNHWTETPIRTADVYVFALLAHRDKTTIDPLNVQQWLFFALPTFELEQRKRSQSSITLNSLRALAGTGVASDSLPAAVVAAFNRQKALSANSEPHDRIDAQ